MNRSDNTYYNISEQIRKGLHRLKDEEFYFYGVYNNCFKIDDMKKILMTVIDQH